MGADGKPGGRDGAASAVSLNEDRFRFGATGIVGFAYRTALQGFWSLLGVSAGLLVPPIVLLVVAVTLLPRSGAIVNGVVTGGPSPLDLIVLIPLALLLVVAGLLAFGACSAMIAGALLGRPLAWSAALRTARLRLLPLGAVVGLLLVVWLGVSVVLVPLISFPLLLLPMLGTGGPEGFGSESPSGPFGFLVGGPSDAFAITGFSLLVSAAIALFALRFLVALPAAVLERLGTAGAALRYAVAVTRGRAAAARLALLVGVVLVPELLARGGTGLTGVLAGGLGLGDSSRMLLHDVLAFGIRVAMVPFQLATLTVTFLNGRLPAREGASPPVPGEPPAVEADLDRIATHLEPGAALGPARIAGPEPAPAPAGSAEPAPDGATAPGAASGGTGAAVPGGRGRRPVLVALGVLAVVVALALPGLLSAGSRAFNPRGFAVVSDRPLPWRIRAESAEATLAMSGGLPLAVIRDGGTLSLLGCEDRGCRGSHRVEVGSGFVSASAATMARPAGSGSPAVGVAVATWRQAGDSRLELRLLTCTASGCGALDQAPLLDQAPIDSKDRRLVAVAARPDGGLVVADLLAAAPAPAGAEPGADGRLRLLFCADTGCPDPRTVTVAGGPDLELTADPNAAPFLPPDLPEATRRLAVTVSPDGRAATALATAGDGPIVVATCDGPECGHPAAARVRIEPGSGGAGSPDDYLQPRHGIDIALPAGGGPLITAEAPGQTATILLACRTPACAGTDRITLVEGGGDGPDAFPIGPAAVELDRQGRPLLAVSNQRDFTPEAVLVACDDGACRRRTTVSLGEINSGSPVSPLDLALDDGDRPAILWGGPDDGPTSIRLRVLTCDTPRCRR